MQVNVKKLHEDAIVPKYETKGAAGFDLSAYLEDGKRYEVVSAGQRKLIKTGLAFEVPEGYELQIRPRSGLSHRNGVVTSFGTIDSDYRGDVGIILYNHGTKPLVVMHGDRIAQGVIKKAKQVELVEVDALSETDRGVKGFGSTGTGA